MTVDSQLPKQPPNLMDKRAGVPHTHTEEWKIKNVTASPYDGGDDSGRPGTYDVGGSKMEKRMLSHSSHRVIISATGPTWSSNTV